MVFMEKLKNLLRFKRSILKSKNFWKIFTVNLISPLLLFIGIFCFNKYQTTIVNHSLNNMKEQASLITTSINEGAVDKSLIKKGEYEKKSYWIKNYSAQRIIDKASDATGVSIKLFNRKGDNIASSSFEYEKPKLENGFLDISVKTLNKLTNNHYEDIKTEDWADKKGRRKDKAKDYKEVMLSLNEKLSDFRIRELKDGSKEIFYSRPIIYRKHMVGALLVSINSQQINKDLLQIQKTIISFFYLSLLMTLILSFYLSKNLLVPIITLAKFAKKNKINDIKANKLINRHDEFTFLHNSFEGMHKDINERISNMKEFVADVSHEIKNPLASIKCAIETIERLDNQEQIDELFDIIKEDIDRTNILINNISSLSRIEFDINRERNETSNIHRIISKLKISYENNNDVKDIKIRFYDKVKNNHLLATTETRILQVFENLINNAISFSPDDGNIDVFLIDHDSDCIRISVQDEGPGIPAGKEDQIFERFFSSRTKKQRSNASYSGLGLAIVKQIIDSLGGTIVARNNPDKNGAIFEIILPAKGE